MFRQIIPNVLNSGWVSCLCWSPFAAHQACLQKFSHVRVAVVCFCDLLLLKGVSNSIAGLPLSMLFSSVCMCVLLCLLSFDFVSVYCTRSTHSQNRSQLLCLHSDASLKLYLASINHWMLTLRSLRLLAIFYWSVGTSSTLRVAQCVERIQ